MFKILLPVVLGLGTCDSQTLRRPLQEDRYPLYHFTPKQMEEIEQTMKDIDRIRKQSVERLIMMDKMQDELHKIEKPWVEEHILMHRVIGDEKGAREWERYGEKADKDYANALAVRKKDKLLRFNGDPNDFHILWNQQEIAKKKAKGESTELLEVGLRKAMSVKASKTLVHIAGYCSKICKYIHDKPARQVIPALLWVLF